jgi:cytochrome P450
LEINMAAATPLKTIPTIPGQPILGNLREVRQKEILRFAEDLRSNYGPIAWVKMGPIQMCFVCEPEHLHHIFVKNAKNYVKGPGYDRLRLLLGNGLVTSDGEVWRQERRLVQPTFTPKAVLDFHEMMVQVTQQIIERWQPLVGQTIHMDEEMMRLTMGVIGEAMFSLDLNAQAVEVGEAFGEAFRYIGEGTSKPVVAPLYVPTPSNLRFKRALRTIHAFIDERIADGRSHPDRHNILTMLLQARDEETNAVMNEEQLRDEVITLFFAGFETTARTLSWAWYLLSQHAEARQKLLAEVDEVLNGRLPTVADLYQLTYTRMVADETLRLYPPTGLVARQAQEDDVIDGYPIPAGTFLMISPHVTHRIPELWPNPDQFIPERFAPGKLNDLHKCAYIPFITGPRVCIGNNFALLEIVIALAMIAQKYELTMPLVPVKSAFVGTTRPSQPLHMMVNGR